MSVALWNLIFAPRDRHHHTWTRAAYGNTGGPGKCLYACTCGARSIH